MNKKEFYELRSIYLRKANGWIEDEEDGLIINFDLQAIFKDGIYYSLIDGRTIGFSPYVKNIRKYVGNEPLQLSGTGVVVYRKNEEGKVSILLQQRTDNKKWGLPGGTIELGEDYKECAVNELVQETTYLADKSKLELFDVYAGPKHITKYPNGDIVFHTVVVFLIEEKYCEKLDVKLDRTETQNIEWFTLEEVGKIIENSKCFSNNIDILEDIIQKFTIQYETNPEK